MLRACSCSCACSDGDSGTGRSEPLDRCVASRKGNTVKVLALLLLATSGCVVPRYTVTVPTQAVVALAGGNPSTVSVDAAPLVIDVAWFDRSVDLVFTTADGKMIRVTTLSDSSNAVVARAADAEVITHAIDTGANATLGVVTP